MHQQKIQRSDSEKIRAVVTFKDRTSNDTHQGEQVTDDKISNKDFQDNIFEHEHD